MSIQLTFSESTKFHDILGRDINVVTVTFTEGELSCEINIGGQLETVKALYTKGLRKSPKAHLGYLGDKVVPLYFKV